MDWISGLLCYFLGAFTFIPLALWITQLYMSIPPSPPPISTAKEVDVTTCHNYGTKKGWIRLSSNYQPKSPTKKKQNNGEGYGVLKQGILKVYNNEMQQHCEWTIDLNHYHVSIYPPGRQEHTLFSRSVALRLQRKEGITINCDDIVGSIQDKEIFFSCSRPIDKEDWYFAFISVSNSSPNHPHAIPFDPMAVASLITSIGKQKQQPSDTDQHQIPWFNAILGRTFLGIYKTRRLQQIVLETLTKKTKKMKTPGFLGDIQIRSVDLGHSIPFVTQPTLVALHPDGTLVLDAHVNYTGGFKVVVEANVGGTFSIRVPLVLSLTLRSLSGTIRFKIKPPPSNRYWIGFCTMPTMKWSIVPGVSNCNVKISMITKIIEAKIRKMMTDNMVLPNMEDIPYANSDGLGGIFHISTDTNNNLMDGLSLHNDSRASDDDLDSSLQQSFVINNSDDQSSISMESQSTSSSTNNTPSPSSGKWSKFFTTRLRKNTGTFPVSTATAISTAIHQKSSTIDLKATMEQESMTGLKDIVQSNQSQRNSNVKIRKEYVVETPKCELNDKENSTDNENDSDNDNNNENDNDKDEITDPYSLSPSSTSTTILVSSTSLTTEQTTAPSSLNDDTTKDDDSASISSTKSSRRKKLYNAAGYIFSKGKGLAGDLREYRHQDLQVKRQQSLLQYSDQLQDMRRRCNENTSRRLSTSSTSSSSITNDRMSSNSTLTKKSIPPLHLIHNEDCPPALPSRKNGVLGDSSVEIFHHQQPSEEKPQLPPRLPPRTFATTQSTSVSQPRNPLNTSISSAHLPQCSTLELIDTGENNDITPSQDLKSMQQKYPSVE
ncbi:putative integral membrane protein conserved region-domain-containing protein [Halteromyces radiatus]|uniref:putative integral membrane protein conserved region-domain-containing protein n=1 Tax=Halteromyces radiatus TaxID=101107 RepID=UPI002220143E|nr:putative integral membrane protein conserved region-domain-containing protein [Halteromyces radiatus]KAI8098857.1 putative integral membrane protein conserved region-domain-containing protein [Halteromyces radiatus]